MATYLMAFSFTEKGLQQIKDSPARVAAAKRIVQELGGQVTAFYAALGSGFDTMFLVEAPSEQKVAEMALAIARSGYVRTTTHRLFNEQEFKEIVS